MKRHINIKSLIINIVVCICSIVAGYYMATEMYQVRPLQEQNARIAYRFYSRLESLCMLDRLDSPQFYDEIKEETLQSAEELHYILDLCEPDAAFSLKYGYYLTIDDINLLKEYFATIADTLKKDKEMLTEEDKTYLTSVERIVSQALKSETPLQALCVLIRE